MSLGWGLNQEITVVGPKRLSAQEIQRLWIQRCGMARIHFGGPDGIRTPDLLNAMPLCAGPHPSRTVAANSKLTSALSRIVQM
jgi:hypothetical protein